MSFVRERHDELMQLAPGLWCIQYHRQALGLHVRTRMSVVDAGGGALWLYSPVPIDDALAARIDALGRVEHILAPNKWHHMFAGPVKERYARATLWGAPGLRAKRPDLAIDAVLGDDGLPQGADVDVAFVPGMPTVNEHVLLHRPSRTLLCCDFVMNVHDESVLPTQLFYRAYGIWRCTAQSRGWKHWTKDRAAARGAVDRILSWSVARVAMAHGDVLDVDAEEALTRATDWLSAT